MSPGLRAEARLTLGPLALAVDLVVAPGELCVLVGPNGAGKTTLLRALAGLQPIDAGRITLDGVVLDDPANATFVPPAARGVGTVFQDGLLFDHLSVVDNVAFGLRARRVPTREARRQAEGWLARFGLAEYARAKPKELSGGQAQRVGLARALAYEPRLVLLDEPFAALDVSTRAEVRREIAAHLAVVAAPKVIVTHDPVEAIALGDRVVVLEHGQVTQLGTPEELRARPRSRYVADLLGVNLLRGRLRGEVVHVEGGGELVVAPGDLADGLVLTTVHPHAITLHTARPEGSARNVWAATVDSIDDEGDRARVRLGAPLPLVVELTAASRTALALAPGSVVWASVKATEIAVHPD